MHSLKNTVVAILLLGVSYGVYQVITTPEPLTTADQSLVEPLDIDDGLSINAPGDEATRPEIQLPSAAPEPGSSPGRPANMKMAPPKLDQSIPSQANSIPSSPTTESLVNRQAKLDFAGNVDVSSIPASPEIESAGSNFARDQELIDALQDQLESHEEASPLQPELQPDSEAEFVSTQPEAAPSPATGNASDPNSFVPRASELEPAPPANLPPTSESKGTGSADPMQAMWSQVESLATAGKFRSALEILTPHFGDPELSETQQQRLMVWLDALAGRVIYSAEHNLGDPYVVQANETLGDIAQRWNITGQLVYNINKSNIPDPAKLAAGTELKMVRGPFHAEIDLTKKVMTLFVDNLYAGRFAVEVDDPTTIQPGQYGVKQKSGTDVDGQSAYRIALDNGICIQASSATDSNPACIGLKPKDAADLFIIFTEQSQFFINR